MVNISRLPRIDRGSTYSVGTAYGSVAMEISLSSDRHQFENLGADS
jgi:hypothetical protein